jgi:heparinase II/III-like protein
MSAAAPLRPRPVFCVVEHAYRSRDIADGACAGRYSHQGVTLDLGVEPDWLGARLPADKEWRLEWSKFYFGLDLAWAAQQTGRDRYQRTWERQVRSWIRQVPAGLDTTDVIGRRIQNWIYAWNGFAAAPGFAGLAAGLADDILGSLAAQIAHLRAHLTPERNHRTLELYALFIAALALPALDRDGELLAFAIDALHRNLLADVLDDGVQRERSTHYHHVVLRSFVGFRENARRFALPVPDGFDARLALACEFAVHSQRPDGTIPALSDSDSGSYLDLIELAGTLLSRADWLYVARRGASGAPPAERHASFPVGGYYVQRSGWGDRGTAIDDERFLIFDCGPIGDGGHGHYDALNIEVAAGGRSLIVDPGRYTYCDDPPHWRRWFKGTAAHNTVTVDGLDQTPYFRGKPRGGSARGRLLQRLQGDGLDVLWGEVHSPAYAAIHRRRVLFVADEYWIVEDTLAAAERHDYALRFHLAPDAGAANDGRLDGSRATYTAPGVALLFVDTPALRLEPGWVASLYGSKVPAPIVVAERAGADARFVTLIVPARERTARPRVPSLRLERRDDGGRLVTTLQVAGVGPNGDDRDVIAWTASGECEWLPDLRAGAAAAWRREPAAGGGARTAVARRVDVVHGRPPGMRCVQEVRS